MITMHTSIRAQASELWDDTQTKQVVKLSGPVKVIIVNDWVRIPEGESGDGVPDYVPVSSRHQTPVPVSSPHSVKWGLNNIQTPVSLKFKETSAERWKPCAARPRNCNRGAKGPSHRGRAGVRYWPARHVRF